MATDDELKRDAEHLDYEVWMLMESTERLRGDKPLPSDPVARKALLEAWLIHLRLLLEFFRTTKSKPDDLRAVDYFDGHTDKPKIEQLAPVKDSWENRRAQEINKALAHIVQDRAKLNTDWNEWDLKLVTSRLTTFFDLLPADRRVWFPRSSRWFARATP